MLKIYNTLTRSKEEFHPILPPRVTFYNCGPTVYDFFHIGNARNFVLADLIRRYLQFSDYEVRFVQNVTDIDDKIISRATEEGCSTEEIVEKYTRAYFDHIEALGIQRADLSPRATDHIADIIAFIQKLIDKGYAYPAGGDVFFRVGYFNGYGKLSGKKIEDLQEGKRVQVDLRKEDPKDFDLWKAAKPGEPKWNSPWGPGRPGWHIECSVMASKHLGETIDIHSGGSDLVFPHHENEIAQAEAVTGKPFAHYWIHNAFLNIDGEKMAKSVGNIVSIDQVLEQHDPQAVRYFFLSAHYRKPMDYSADSLDEAAKALGRLLDGIDTIEKVLALTSPKGEMDSEPAAEMDQRALKDIREEFCEYMDDDFNTPRALSVLFDAVSDLHEKRRSFDKPVGGPQARAFARGSIAMIKEFGQVLGLDLKPKGTADLPVEGLIAWPGEVFRNLKAVGATDLAESLAWQIENVRLAILATATSIAPGTSDLQTAVGTVMVTVAPHGSPLQAATASMGLQVKSRAPTNQELLGANVAMDQLTKSLTSETAKQEAAKEAVEKLASSVSPKIADLRAAMAKMLEASRAVKAGPDPAENKIREAFAAALMEIAIQVRNMAREAKQFEAADLIRDSLRELNLTLEDYSAGTIWKKE